MAELNELLQECVNKIDGLIDECRELGIDEITIDGWRHQESALIVLGKFFARGEEGLAAEKAKRR